MGELSWTAKWELGRIEEAIPKLRTELVRLETALDEKTGVVGQPEQYAVQKLCSQKSVRSFPTPSAAEEAMEKAFEESNAIREKNTTIVATNLRVIQMLQQFVENARIPTTYIKYNYGRQGKTTKEEYDWFAGMKQVIPVSDGWGTVERLQKEWKRECEKWDQELKQKEAAREAAEKAEKAKFEREIVRRQFVKQFDLPENTDFDDILDVILRKNKYLRLAHYLSLNRSDWSDGPSYAETGLDEFVEETDEDREIAKELWGYVNDWCGDGRVFRDCKWSYGVLFGKVPAELMEEYNKVNQYVDRW